MLTVEKLKAYGANTAEGVKRCLDDEEFYIELVESAIPDERINELERYIKAKDLDKAFETAHALKGMYGNISITPVYEPISKMTEMLRSRTDTDYSALIAEAKRQKQKLVDLYNS